MPEPAPAPIQAHVHLSGIRRTPLPLEFRDQDVRFTEELVAHFVERYTQPGGVVFDPFAGFGTTLVAAEALGRVAYGLELDPARAAYIRGLLQHPERLVHGDARRLAAYDLPPFDLALSSPPYMQRHDRQDPFTAYTQPGRGYASYLRTIRDIYAQVRALMNPGARVVIEAGTLQGPTGITTLAWDIARVVGEVLVFEGETVVLWEPPPAEGYDVSYGLVFGAPDECKGGMP